MKHAVAGIDPGKTTGCFGAIVYTHDHGPTWSLTTHHELTSALQVRGWLETFIDASETDNIVVAVERYTITPRTHKLSRQPAALEVIGVVKELCEQMHVDCRMQMKSEVVKLGSNRKLRALGWYSTGQEHANDAARHALTVLAHHDKSAFASLVGAIV